MPNGIIEYDSFRDFASSCQSNWDCDEDAHKHGTECRSCTAMDLLKRFPVTEQWVVDSRRKSDEPSHFTVWDSYDDALAHAVKEWRARDLGYDEHTKKFYIPDAYAKTLETRYSIDNKVVGVIHAGGSGPHILIQKSEND